MTPLITRMFLALAGIFIFAFSEPATAQDVPAGILQTITVDEFEPGGVFTAGGGAIYHSTDFGGAWSRSDAGSSIWSIAVAPYDPVGDPDAVATYYAATQDRGVMRSNNGSEWIDTIGLGGEVHSVVVHPYNGLVYAGANSGIFVSTDLGLNWALLSDAVGDGITQGLLIDPVNPLNMYAAKWGQGVFRSVDGGNTWLPGHSGLFDTQLFDLDLHPVNRSVLFASTPSGVYQSVDAGASWVLLDSPQNVSELAIDPGNPDTMLLVTEGNGIAKSIDGGQSWRAVSDGLGGELMFASIAIEPTGSGRVYVGSYNQGLFFSNDMGDSWAASPDLSQSPPSSTPPPPSPTSPPPFPVPPAGPTTLTIQIIDKNGSKVQLGDRANFDVVIRNIGSEQAVDTYTSLFWSQPSSAGTGRAVSGNWPGGVCDSAGYCAIGGLPAGGTVTIAVSGSTSSTMVEDFSLIASAGAANSGDVTASRAVDVVRSVLTVESGGGGALSSVLLIALGLIRIGNLSQIVTGKENEKNSGRTLLRSYCSLTQTLGKGRRRLMQHYCRNFYKYFTRPLLAICALLHFGGCAPDPGVGGILSSPPPPPPPAVQADEALTTEGIVRGTLDNGLKVFKGVRYAAPPTGVRRFKAPAPPASFAGVLDATQFGDVCPQPGGGGVMGNEDCLFLNIWSHEEITARPVIVFLHGGGANGAGGSASAIDGEALAMATNMIVVTINRRLGALGYLAIDELVQENAGSTAGNYATLDVIAALRWLNDNLDAFNGDTTHVMLAGQSSGAGVVCDVLSSPESAGFFHAAALHSPPCGLQPVLNDQVGIPSDDEFVTVEHREFVEFFNCETSADVLDCLRLLTADEIVLAEEQLFADFVGLIDGVVIPDNVFNALENETAGPVPVIVGSNADEMAQIFSRNPIVDDADYQQRLEFIFDVPLSDNIYTMYPTADFNSAHQAWLTLFGDLLFNCPAEAIATNAEGGAPAYLYNFKRGFDSGSLAGFGAVHTIDVAHLFGTFDLWGYTPDAQAMELSTAMRYGWRILTMDPTAAPPYLANGSSSWPAFTAANKQVVEFGDTIAIANEHRGDRCQSLYALF